MLGMRKEKGGRFDQNTFYVCMKLSNNKDIKAIYCILNIFQKDPTQIKRKVVYIDLT